MKNIDLINKENFNESFNLVEIITDSVFYPASGIDARDIECLSTVSNSFVHVDYSTSKDVVEYGMKNHFEGVGFKLVGIKDVSYQEITPIGFQARNFQLNGHEKERLAIDFIQERFSSKNFTPFALWAVYERNTNKTGSTDEKTKRFSLLHIGAEACATLNALYISNRINPLGVAIISPGEGYGDNWTIFRDPNFRLYQDLLHNHKTNNIDMPQILLSNMGLSDTDPCFWPDYSFTHKSFSDSWLQHFRRG
jgi:hypothetical protein